MIFELLDVIRHKIPMLSLFFQVMIVNIFYTDCSKLDDDTYTIGFWIYFPLICLICLILETFSTIKRFSQLYSHKRLKSRICVGVCSILISLSTFCSTSYFIETGRPFSCVFEYNHLIAIIAFCVNIVIIVTFSIFEHYHWGIVRSLLPMYIQTNANHSPNGSLSDLLRSYGRSSIERSNESLLDAYIIAT
jgi:hypothetical protein